MKTKLLYIMKGLRYFLIILVISISCAKQNEPDEIIDAAIITDEALQIVNNVIDNALSEESSIDPQLVADEIASIKGVKSATPSSSGVCIRIELSDETFTNVFLVTKDDERLFEETTTKSLATKLDTAIFQQYVPVFPNGDGKALILAPFQRFFLENLSRIEEDLMLAGYSVDIYKNDQATLDRFRGSFLAEYDVVYINSHGGAGVATLGGDLRTAVLTGEAYNLSTRKSLSYDEKQGIVKIAAYKFGKEYFGISAQWLRETQGKAFPNSWIFINACESADSTESLSEAFFEMGAVGYHGWKYITSNIFSNHTGARLFDYFTSGLSFNDASDNTRNTLSLLTPFELRNPFKRFDKSYLVNVKNTNDPFYIVEPKGDPPVADFTVDEREPDVNETVQFEDRSTNNPTSWSWNFGDGHTSTLEDPPHEYTTAGTYTVSLTAFNSYGQNKKTELNYMTVSIPGQAPVADFTVDEREPDVNETVQFEDRSTNNPTSWSWNFGDGHTSTLEDPPHEYTTAGTYTVSLTAFNSYGQNKKTELNYMTVSIPGQAPVADFIVNNQEPDVDETVYFEDRSTNNPTEWYWHYSVGGENWIEFSRQENPTFTFNSAGMYSIWLVAQNDYGIDYEIKTSYINVGNAILFNPNLTYGTLEDIDNNIYRTIRIGNQVWMAENLRVTRYADGTQIRYVDNATDWGTWENPRAYTWYNLNETIKYAYGALYSWEGAMNGEESSSTNPSYIQGVCPYGWHLPSDEEWKELEMELGMSQTEADDTGDRGTDQGGKLKEIEYFHWYNRNDGATNESGFTALPGGYIGHYDSFRDLNYYGYWWTATLEDETEPWYRMLDGMVTMVKRFSGFDDAGMSVRCVQNYGE